LVFTQSSGVISSTPEVVDIDKLQQNSATSNSTDYFSSTATIAKGAEANALIMDGKVSTGALQAS